MRKRMLQISVLLLIIAITAAMFIFLMEIKTRKIIAPKFIIQGLPENENKVFPESVKKESSIKMLFLGDLMLDRHVGEKIKANGLDYIFKNLQEKNFFNGYDLISANLEGAVTEAGAHYAPMNGYDFAFSPIVISELKKYKFTFFNIANNHLSDQGEKGIKETENNLAELKYSFSGCADSRTGKCSSKIIEIGGKKIGLAGFSMVYKRIPEEEMKKEINSLASSTDFLIVNAHWGNEYQHNFSQSQEKTAHFFIDSGADIIIGHHPHVVQGLEIYKGKPIFYSLGNFVFDQYFSPDTQEGVAVSIELAGENIKINIYPLKSKLSQPDLMVADEKKKFLEKFISWSKFEDNIISQLQNGEFTLPLVRK